MARIVKRRKKQKTGLEFFAFACNLFAVSVIIFLFSSLFLRSYNNGLSASTQSIDGQIADLQEKNEAVQAEINELASNERVSEVAGENGLAYNQNNITAVTGDTETSSN